MMSFQKIIGHDKIIKFLKTAIKNDSLAHAYIFEGRIGIGKKTSALEFAKAICCKESLDDSCDICTSCHKIDSGNHPDIEIISPDGKSIKNKQIEEFQNNILLRPYESNKKIFLIEASNTMTVSAQNRLLKILEEPPSYGIIILITENSYGLLPTIRSRCQTIKFNRIPKEDIAKYLIERYNLNKEESLVYSIFSDGSLGRALDIYQSEEFKERRSEIIKIIDKIAIGDRLKLIDSVEFFEKNKDYMEELLDLLAIWFRDMLLLKEIDDEKKLFNIDYKNKVREYMNVFTGYRIMKAINIIEETRKNIKSNVNLNVSIETMLLNILEV